MGDSCPWSVHSTLDNCIKFPCLLNQQQTIWSDLTVLNLSVSTVWVSVREVYVNPHIFPKFQRVLYVVTWPFFPDIEHEAKSAFEQSWT